MMSGFVRVDPHLLVIVAARRAANRRERPAAVGRLPGHDGRDDHDVGIGRVHADVARVGRAREHARVAVDARPRLARIIRSEHAGVSRLDDGKHARRTARRNADADAADAIGVPRRQARGELAPGRAAVAGLEEAAVRPVEGAVFPRALPRLPQRRVDDVGVRGIEQHVDAAGVLVLVEHALEAPAAVDRSEDAALGVGSVRMAERRHEQRDRRSSDRSRPARSAACRAGRGASRSCRRRSTCRCRRRWPGRDAAAPRRCRRR